MFVARAPAHPKGLPPLAERLSDAAKEKVNTVQDYFALAGRAE